MTKKKEFVKDDSDLLFGFKPKNAKKDDTKKADTKKATSTPKKKVKRK